MRLTILALAASALSAMPAAAQARNIVITNDDGLTSNVVALYKELVEAGHEVIVSVPCGNQSGMGAAIKFGRPLGPLAEACLNDAAKAGDPGAGPMTREGLSADFNYVDGTPVMAMLYGVDVAARKRWGTTPDLVLSGPNEGQNVGAIVIASGTVSAAQFAALRGLPAIALSAGADTESADLANPLSTEVAAHVVDLVTALDQRAEGGRLLPLGLALNVNFPDDPTDARWQLSQLGNFNNYTVAFAENLKADASPMMAAMAKARGQELPELPGVSISINEDEPAADELRDESVVYRSAIAVSPMQAGYGIDLGEASWLEWSLPTLLAPE